MSEIFEYSEFTKAPFNDWQEIDIITSRDCVLRCSYCYLDKHKDNHYDMDAIVDSLDNYLKNIEENSLDGIIPEGVVLSFYPEPWVNIERTNELVLRCLKVLEKHPPYDHNFMIMSGTSGAFLHRPIPVFEHIIEHLSIAVTLDGVKEQHDMYRLFPDGSPTWEIVKNNILKYRQKYSIFSTKITLGPNTLKFIYESLVFCFEEMDYLDVNINVVFEDLWGTPEERQKSLEIYEEQLEKCYNYLIETGSWKYKFFSLLGGRHIPRHQMDSASSPAFKTPVFSGKSFCGAAKMRSIDSDGKMYPCFRLSPYALAEDPKYRLFNETINPEVERSLLMLNTFDSVVDKCVNCTLIDSCAMCVGGAYEEKKTIYHRTSNHCEFQKLQYKWSLKLHNALNEPQYQIKEIELE